MQDKMDALTTEMQAKKDQALSQISMGNQACP